MAGEKLRIQQPEPAQPQPRNQRRQAAFAGVCHTGEHRFAEEHSSDRHPIEAADEIARGNEAALRVRALADRTAVELVSDARRQSEIIRGEADAKRNATYADAFGRDPEFFEFYRSMTAYVRAIGGGNGSIVVSPDSDFFNYLLSDQAKATQ